MGRPCIFPTPEPPKDTATMTKRQHPRHRSSAHAFPNQSQLRPSNCPGLQLLRLQKSHRLRIDHPPSLTPRAPASPPSTAPQPPRVHILIIEPLPHQQRSALRPHAPLLSTAASAASSTRCACPRCLLLSPPLSIQRARGFRSHRPFNGSGA